MLVDRLRDAIARLNPAIPNVAREDALKKVLDLGVPSQLAANRQFHKLLVNGVPVQYQKAGETLGDLVRLVDFANVAANEWLAINQYSIKGPHHTRRPDIILFVNGLPLVLLELKNPADEAADIWKAFDQIQTYKEQIPDVFEYNELLVISDGSDARFGSLSANAERFMQWRTIDGVNLDPLGEFNELETLIRGLLAPAVLLDYIRFFVLFEDDGTLVKKVAGYHQYHAVRSAIEHVVTASRPGGTHKGGVVWHTQGSGKSITMTCFAARVMQERNKALQEADRLNAAALEQNIEKDGALAAQGAALTAQGAALSTVAGENSALKRKEAAEKAKIPKIDQAILAPMCERRDP